MLEVVKESALFHWAPRSSSSAVSTVENIVNDMMEGTQTATMRSEEFLKLILDRLPFFCVWFDKKSTKTLEGKPALSEKIKELAGKAGKGESITFDDLVPIHAFSLALHSRAAENGGRLDRRGSQGLERQNAQTAEEWH